MIGVVPPPPPPPLEEGVAFTVSVNEVVFVIPPAVPVTVTVELPAPVELSVLIVSVDVQVGLHEEDEKLPVAPVGKPETVNDVASVVPEERVAVIVFVTPLPCVTTIVPELERVKSKEDGGDESDSVVALASLEKGEVPEALEVEILYV